MANIAPLVALLVVLAVVAIVIAVSCLRVPTTAVLSTQAVATSGLGGTISTNQIPLGTGASASQFQQAPTQNPGFVAYQQASAPSSAQSSGFVAYQQAPTQNPGIVASQFQQAPAQNSGTGSAAQQGAMATQDILSSIRLNALNASSPVTPANTPGQSSYAVALLELSGEGSVSDDVPIAVSFEYLSDLNNNFPITIVDTQSSIPNTLALLQKYYDAGYRVFIGFSSSTTLAGVINWFLSHQDTVGVSLLSTATSLAINKNVIRLDPNDTFTAYFMCQFINRGQYGTVYFIIENGLLVAQDLYASMLPQLSPSITTVAVYVNNLATDLQSQQELNRVLTNLEPNSIIVPIILDTSSAAAYRAQIVATLPPDQIPPQLDTINDTEPTFTSAESIAFNGKYFFLTVSNIYSLANQELQQILGPYFSGNAFDAFNIARVGSDIVTSNKPISGIYSIVDHLLGHAGTLQLNNYNDKQYSFFAIEVWKDGTWNAYNFMGSDPTFGIFYTVVLATQHQI